MKTQVKRILKTRGNVSEIELANRKKILLPPFINVKNGDILEFLPNFKEYNRINKIITDPDTGEIQKVTIFPPYQKKETIFIPPHTFNIIFRERFDDKDWKKVKFLEQFHYRGKEFNKIVGKRTVLLAELENYGVIGFGMLSAATAVAGPRFKLLNTNFKQQMRSKLINRIIRVPRIVIHPEFRGMGIGTLMAKHLVLYAEQYWAVNQYKPKIIEVIAAMTDYHRFFENAGFINYDRTSGYGGSGIKPQYGKGSFESRKNTDSYDFMKNQESKPYLVYPIDNKIRKQLRHFTRSKNFDVLLKKPQLKEKIFFKDVNVHYHPKKYECERCDKIRNAFGIVNGNSTSNILPNFSLIVEPGDVVLLTGASGSGKSTILKLLTLNPIKKLDEMDCTGILPNINECDIEILDSNSYPSIPLIDQIKQDEPLEEAIKLLNSVGLSEAHLYLKDPSQISDGQKYRFAIAKLCDSKKPIWVADEFVSSLNPEMAAIVSKGLRKIAYLYGSTLFLAAPHICYFKESLIPNKLIIVQWGKEAKIFSLKIQLNDDENILSFNLLNNGQMPLSKILIGFTNITGKFFTKQTIESLKPAENIEMEISKKYLRDVQTIVIKTNEGIGDIFYLK
jgi:ABC-type ATPase with predicted acetyltransferase domain